MCLRAPPYLVVEEHAGEVDDGLVHRLIEDLAVDFWRDIERKEGKQRVYANAPPKRGPRHQPMVPSLPALHTHATTMHTYTRLDTHTKTIRGRLDGPGGGDVLGGEVEEVDEVDAEVVAGVLQHAPAPVQEQEAAHGCFLGFRD